MSACSILTGSPLIAAAACIRGFIDTILYLIEKGLHWVADMLETADAYLANKLGPPGVQAKAKRNHKKR
jgi:hypothetical protein